MFYITFNIPSKGKTKTATCEVETEIEAKMLMEFLLVNQKDCKAISVNAPPADAKITTIRKIIGMIGEDAAQHIKKCKAELKQKLKQIDHYSRLKFYADVLTMLCQMKEGVEEVEEDLKLAPLPDEATEETAEDILEPEKPGDGNE